MVCECAVVPVSVGLVGSVVTSVEITVVASESVVALVSVGLVGSVVASGESATITFESAVALESRGEPGVGETGAESTASAGPAVLIEACEVGVCGTHAEAAVTEAVSRPALAQALHQAAPTTYLAQPIRTAQLLDDRGECVGRDGQLFGGERRLDARARIGQSFVDASEGSVALRRDRRAALGEGDPPTHHEVTDTEASEACAPVAPVILVAAGVVSVTVATVIVASVIVVTVTAVSVTVVSVTVVFAGVLPAGVPPAGILVRPVGERRTVLCAVARAGAIEQ
jgi:hypothetical protein